LVVFCGLCLAAETDAHKPRKVAPGLYELGALRIDANRRTVRAPGRVNMREGGPIELLACLERGKVHESVFLLDIEPLDLQLALLLLDLEPGRNPAVAYAEDAPEREKPPAPCVRVAVEWRAPPKDEGDEPALVRYDAGALLRNVQAGGTADGVQWAFIGSAWDGDRFAADLEGSLIATFRDRTCILELAADEVNDDVFFHANKALLPPPGTVVELVVQAPPLPDDEEEE
jgi:hypothetical protein